MKSIKTILFSLSISGILILGIYLTISWFVTDYQIKFDEKWRQKTSPLSQDVISDLCNVFELKSGELCKDERTVYAPDFFPVISQMFDKKDTTYASVQQKLGKYQVELESASQTQDGKTYFVSKYDLRGDGETSIAFFFYGTPDNSQFMKVKFHYSRFGF